MEILGMNRCRRLFRFQARVLPLGDRHRMAMVRERRCHAMARVCLVIHRRRFLEFDDVAPTAAATDHGEHRRIAVRDFACRGLV